VGTGEWIAAEVCKTGDSEDSGSWLCEVTLEQSVHGGGAGSSVEPHQQRRRGVPILSGKEPPEQVGAAALVHRRVARVLLSDGQGREGGEVDAGSGLGCFRGIVVVEEHGGGMHLVVSARGVNGHRRARPEQRIGAGEDACEDAQNEENNERGTHLRTDHWAMLRQCEL
jgi:hypothetical protein